MIDVTRPAEAPASLAARNRYNGDDVREALHALFLEKCYLCETPVGLGTFEVDHRRPQGQDEEQRFAWENLFPTCTEYKCNQRREKTYPAGGLLDPGQGVESRISQRFEYSLSSNFRSTGSASIVFLPLDPADIPARNTAAELDRIHNGTGSTAAAAARDLRIKIQDHVASVIHAAFDFVNPDPAADLRKKQEAEARMRLFVSRRAPYSMLVRSVFERSPSIKALFD